jgi:hypothetical protein
LDHRDSNVTFQNLKIISERHVFEQLIMGDTREQFSPDGIFWKVFHLQVMVILLILSFNQRLFLVKVSEWMTVRYLRLSCTVGIESQVVNPIKGTIRNRNKEPQ